MLSIQDKTDYSIRTIEKRVNDIINHIKDSTNFLNSQEFIMDFLNNHICHCRMLIQEEQYKDSLLILIKLNDICLKAILYRPIEINLRLKTILQDIEDLIIDSEKRKDESVSIDPTILIKNIKHFEKNMTSKCEDIYTDSPGRFYFDLIVNLCDILNNIGVIYHKRNRLMKSLYYINLSGDILMKAGITLYEVVFKYTDIVLNLILSMDDNTDIDVIGQVFCNVIIILEKLDGELEKKSNVKECFRQIELKSKGIFNLVESSWDKRMICEFTHPKSTYIHKISCYYNYYARLLQKQNKEIEAEYAFEQSDMLYKQIIKQENSQKKLQKQESNLTTNNLTKFSTSNPMPPPSRGPHGDNFSSISYHTGKSGLTLNSTISSGLSAVTRENVIYQKYVELHNTVYKIIMAHLKSINYIEIIVYSKQQTFLKKIFVQFQDFLDFAIKKGILLDSEQDSKHALNMIARNLYIKDDNLHIKEISYKTSVDDIDQL